MDKREIYKTVKIDKREWRIGKFDAMTGSYIAYQLMGQFLPMGIKLDGIPSAPAGSKTMAKSDFIDLQKECLKICDEILPAGPAPVYLENGTWGVEGVEKNAKIALGLTVQALMWNLTDFFDEDLLQNLATGFMDLTKPIALI